MDYLSFREPTSRDFHTCVCRGIPLVVRAAPPAAVWSRLLLYPEQIDPRYTQPTIFLSICSVHDSQSSSNQQAHFLRIE